MKSVLMPPISIDEDQDTDLKKTKTGANVVPREGKTNESPSEQLPKHEWEQVGIKVFTKVAVKMPH